MIRRLVVAALVALLAFTLVGCGGGGEEQAAAPEGEQAAPPAPAPPAAPGEVAVIADRSAEESAVFEPFPKGDFVPAEISKRLNAKPKQPMILFFYDDTQLEYDDAEAEVEEVASDNAGAVDLLKYNVGQFTSVDQSGVVSASPGLNANESAKQMVTLARELGVKFTPFVVVVDDQGYVIFKWRGYIDAEMLGRQVDRTKKRD